ncbi:MFS general substrate transporter [Annulohypoxylon maeteangense]|uniref:MFS general substrate transporter n=1 Tax=Annulohypoxylon maeteangense TaxID=1927788 RepID=UPI0020077AE4|nr:MFS general substrate transporter [Annulohypoxylon maeteangense]KAI0879817.1 MFS general substrate transporter [Annulohypoxylon maeteangense]
MNSQPTVRDGLARDVESRLNEEHGKGESDGAILEDRDRGNHADDELSPPRDDRDGTTNTNQPLMSGWPFYVLMASVTLGVLLIAFNATAVGTAIPAITNEFNTVNDVGWYSSAYLIANCVMVPFVGKLYRSFRIKVVFITFIVIFEIGSLIAALSTSSMMLIIARAISGIGGSGILNGGSTIVAATVPIANRSFLNGIILGCFAVGQAAGPLIGGALTQGITWRWCFYINLPVGGLVVFLFVFVVRLPVSRLSEVQTSLLQRVLDIDFVGFVFFAAASLMLLIGLQWGGTEYPWNSSTVIGLMCGGAATFGVLGFWFAYKGEAALLPPRLLRNRINTMITITSFVQSGGSINALYWLPVWFQAIQGADALRSGVMILPLILSQLVASVVCGALVQKTGYYLPEVIGGNALVAIGAGLTSTFTPTTPLGNIIGYQILMGAGRGFVLQLLVTAIQANCPREDASIATGYAMFSQLLGGAIFSAVGKSIFTSSIPTALQKFAPDIDANLVINSGVTEISKVVPSDKLAGTLLAYNQAINHVFYLQIAAAGCAFLSGWGMGWKNLKQIKQEQEREKEEKSDAELTAARPCEKE